MTRGTYAVYEWTIKCLSYGCVVINKSFMFIVRIKIFSRWFIVNKDIIITSTALKLCDVTDDVMS